MLGLYSVVLLLVVFECIERDCGPSVRFSKFYLSLERLNLTLSHKKWESAKLGYTTLKCFLYSNQLPVLINLKLNVIVLQHNQTKKERRHEKKYSASTLF